MYNSRMLSSGPWLWKVDVELSTKTKCSMTFITHNIPYNITLNRK